MIRPNISNQGHVVHKDTSFKSVSAILDCGATDTFLKDYMPQFGPPRNRGSLRVANNQVEPILGKTDLQATVSGVPLQMGTSFHAPSLSRNLVSINSLMLEGNSTFFNSSSSPITLTIPSGVSLYTRDHQWIPVRRDGKLFKIDLQCPSEGDKNISQQQSTHEGHAYNGEVESSQTPQTRRSSRTPKPSSKVMDTPPETKSPGNSTSRKGKSKKGSKGSAPVVKKPSHKPLSDKVLELRKFSFQRGQKVLISKSNPIFHQLDVSKEEEFIVGFIKQPKGKLDNSRQKYSVSCPAVSRKVLYIWDTEMQAAPSDDSSTNSPVSSSEIPPVSEEKWKCLYISKSVEYRFL